MKKLFALLGAILSVLYLISPVDLIPEAVFGPLGLIDDAAIIPILLGCLRTLGVDLSRILPGKSKPKATKKGESDKDIIDID